MNDLHPAAVSFTLRAPRRWWFVLITAWLLGAAASVYQLALALHPAAGLAHGPNAWSSQPWLGVASCAVVGIALIVHFLRVPGVRGPAVLNYAHGEWALLQAAPATQGQSNGNAELLGEVELKLDWQSMVIARFTSGHSASWLWLESSAHPTRWQDLRRALLSRGARAPKSDPTQPSAAPATPAATMSPP